MEWFRFYTRTLDSAKVQKLVPVLFKHWVNLCCLARIHDGSLPPFPVIAFRLRITAAQAEQVVDALVHSQLIDIKEDGSRWMHDWEDHQRASDNVSARVAKHREKRTSNVTVTPQSRADTETEQRQSRDGAFAPPPERLPPQSATEYPLTREELRTRDPATDDFFVLRLVQTTYQALISAGDMAPFDDEDMANAVRESYKTYRGKREHGNGLLLSRVPQIILGWGKNGTTKQA